MDNKIKLLNFELTTTCPLKCPQCYCSLNTGKNMNRDTALYWIDEAVQNDVAVLNFSGGETMCYPYLYEVIQYAYRKHIKVNVALSGFGLNEDSYKKLMDAGVSDIFISLNGSTDDINRHSRNGYYLAISALKLLLEKKHKNTTINWVMQASNADDFENMIALAERYNVARLVVISLKPDSAYDMTNVPTAQQIRSVASVIRKYDGAVQLCVESCFSPMLAVIGESFLFGNNNIENDKGCMAGRMFASISVDGFLSPCRHLYYFEKWNSLKEYWEKSDALRVIRNVESDVREPCNSCRYGPYCRHCLAINASINNAIYIGNETCDLWRVQ